MITLEWFEQGGWFEDIKEPISILNFFISFLRVAGQPPHKMTLANLYIMFYIKNNQGHDKFWRDFLSPS